MWALLMKLLTPNPSLSNRHRVTFFSPIYFPCCHDNGHRNKMWSAFLQQWVYGSNNNTIQKKLPIFGRGQKSAPNHLGKRLLPPPPPNGKCPFEQTTSQKGVFPYGKYFCQVKKSNDSNFSLLANKIRSDSFSLNTRKEEKKHENNKKVEKVTGSSIFLLSAITTNILPLSEPVFSHKNNFFCAICCCLYVCCCCCCRCCCNFQTLSNGCDLCLNNLFPTFGKKLLKF